MSVDDSQSILIVEDDERLASLTQEYLQKNGFKAEIEPDGRNAISRIINEQPSLVVLDLMLPGADGFTVCRSVRNDYKGPILMLTARSDDVDQILGLEIGADDYVSKPAKPRVLLARIQSLLRRSTQDVDLSSLESKEEQTLTFGPLVVDNSRREAWLVDESSEKTEIELTSAEFDLLWLLASNAGRILSREEIFSELRGIEYDGQDRSVDVRISRIRSKIGDDPIHPRRIKTIRSKGYLFVKEV
ncbi:winged helix-turn-helix domain-containing protein [Marinomonas mediterranea]|jgi:two component transcriptional regulator, winged helix family|uniref:Two component transcriptional regulator, winged helix family n=1 Tax=Marinomonas mediterranea (strain ATCC 700492 / JCM 21426 / NBRC 103028 / MMB-1) TaxID=717774 RepID=F2K1I6_MARM1|nr:winged helix-turn-helix domain-containing protein [Marinomonas mediterranea]ADZ92216.1 two component transcriptional regulator, winged helix family [Marinomonas mediterranea MMB-1]WCN10175.1 response regulator [Marinomonas mediterranea]WCN14220.1 response regulator [Marinomonas mediterranea]WCN18276.1 response regulator [Marinomonas mediterranea MMB-1]